MRFPWNMPTRLFFGSGSLHKHKGHLATLGARALIVTGTNGAEQCGALAHCEATLNALGITSTRFSNVEPNPSVETVQAGAEAARSCDAQFIIGIGGGSPMDAAKAIAIVYGTTYGEAIYRGRFEAPVLPMVAIPTTAGTGSEVTPYAIITDHQKGVKRSIANPVIFPRFSFLDSDYLASLPPKTLINTAIDAFSHAAEGYLAKKATPLSDLLALESIRLLGELLPGLSPESMDRQKRDNLMYASMLAGMVIAQAGTTITHGMGYAMTVYNRVDHGRANGLLFPAFMSWSMEYQREKCELLLGALGLGTIRQLQELMTSLLGPTEDLTDDDLERLITKAAHTGNVQNTLPEPTKEQIRHMIMGTFR